jgi:hypothetical protein
LTAQLNKQEKKRGRKLRVSFFEPDAKGCLCPAGWKNTEKSGLILYPGN